MISARFHAQMEALLSPHGEYRAARMKSFTRCMAKTSAKGDYGEKALEAEGLEVHDPLCRHLKDVLRCTLVLADHAALGKAHAALLAKHTPVGTKDRRRGCCRRATCCRRCGSRASSSRCSSTLPRVRAPACACEPLPTLLLTATAAPIPCPQC